MDGFLRSVGDFLQQPVVRAVISPGLPGLDILGQGQASPANALIGGLLGNAVLGAVGAPLAIRHERPIHEHLKEDIEHAIGDFEHEPHHLRRIFGMDNVPGLLRDNDRELLKSSTGFLRHTMDKHHDEQRRKEIFEILVPHGPEVTRDDIFRLIRDNHLDALRVLESVVSGDVLDGIEINPRRRASKVQLNVVGFATKFGNAEILTELEALGDKTAATLATCFERILRLIDGRVLPARGGDDQPQAVPDI